MSNLDRNAVEAKATRIKIMVERQHKGVDILFSDNGNGISPGNRDRIYRSFFTTRCDSGGMGLGLGIVRSLIEAHNGTIEPMNAEEGAMFALHFQRS